MDDRTAKALLATGKPVVDVYGRLEDSPFVTLRLDDEAIAEMAASFFANRMFGFVATCGYPGLRFSDARDAVFAREAKERGMRCSVYSGEAPGQVKDTFFRKEMTGQVPDEAALATWLSGLPKPTAVFCCNDIRAFQVMKVCEATGLRVPEEIAVLGVDNDTLLCSFTATPFSSIDTHPFALGRRAGELLADLFAHPARHGRTVLHPPRRVIERASTDTYQFSIKWISDALVYIRRNLTSGVNASDVVRHVGYSHTTVNNAFRYELGTTVQQEIIRQRLELACRLLAETETSAAKIATDAGFRNPQYFSKVFSEAFRQTPDAWRRERRSV